MMWLRLSILFLLFGMLGILQTSFLVHFNIMGVSPNLIFILFYIVFFFEESRKYIQTIFSALTAGFFLDTFSSLSFGISSVYLLIIAVTLKYILYSLKKKEEEYPIAYFANLFIFSFILYELLLAMTMYFSNSPHLPPVFNWIFLTEVIYNLVFAITGFYIYKKCKLYKLGY